MSEPTIKIITSPTVRLVGRLAIDEAALDGFLQDEGVESWETDTDNAGQKLVEIGGRLCYKSYAKPRPGGNAKYLEHILEVGHGSVVEHTVYNFIITGVSRSFSHELVRHRAGWAYSQRSQRFVDEGDLSAVVPQALAEEVAEANRVIAHYREERVIDSCEGAKRLLQMATDCDIEDLTPMAGAGLRWLAAMDQARRDYSYLADYLAVKFTPRVPDAATPLEMRTRARKRAREAARSVLPNATETQLFVTANARALRHFIEARGDEHADAEIRRVAIAMLEILQAEAPNLFGDYRIEDCPNGGRMASTPYRKV